VTPNRAKPIDLRTPAAMGRGPVASLGALGTEEATR